MIDLEAIINNLDKLVNHLKNRKAINGVETFSSFLILFCNSNINDATLMEYNLNLLAHNIRGILKFGEFEKEEVEVMNTILFEIMN